MECLSSAGGCCLYCGSRCSRWFVGVFGYSLMNGKRQMVSDQFIQVQKTLRNDRILCVYMWSPESRLFKRSAFRLHRWRDVEMHAAEWRKRSSAMLKVNCREGIRGQRINQTPRWRPSSDRLSPALPRPKRGAILPGIVSWIHPDGLYLEWFWRVFMDSLMLRFRRANSVMLVPKSGWVQWKRVLSNMKHCFDIFHGTGIVFWRYAVLEALKSSCFVGINGSIQAA